MSAAGRAAWDAADQVRTLNHLTLNASELDHSDVYEVVGALSQLLGGLPQALRQISRGAQSWGDRLRLDAETEDPAIVLARFLDDLRVVEQTLAVLRDTLDVAHNRASHFIVRDEVSA